MDITKDEIWGASAATLRRVLYKVIEVTSDNRLKAEIEYAINGNYNHFSLKDRDVSVIGDFIKATKFLLQENLDSGRTDLPATSARDLFQELIGKLEKRL